MYVLCMYVCMYNVCMYHDMPYQIHVFLKCNYFSVIFLIMLFISFFNDKVKYPHIIRKMYKYPHIIRKMYNSISITYHNIKTYSQQSSHCGMKETKCSTTEFLFTDRVAVCVYIYSNQQTNMAQLMSQMIITMLPYQQKIQFHQIADVIECVWYDCYDDHYLPIMGCLDMQNQQGK